MSLVNAFINQIGREIGREVYRNARVRSSKHIPSLSYTDFNKDFSKSHISKSQYKILQSTTRAQT